MLAGVPQPPHQVKLSEHSRVVAVANLVVMAKVEPSEMLVELACFVEEGCRQGWIGVEVEDCLEQAERPQVLLELLRPGRIAGGGRNPVGDLLLDGREERLLDDHLERVQARLIELVRAADPSQSLVQRLVALTAAIQAPLNPATSPHASPDR
jgi:hypothetical protein